MRIVSLLSLASALSVSVGCEKQEPRHDTSAASDAGTSKVGADEPDLARAVASVASPRQNNAESAADGPPPNGIFAPGQADKAMAKGSPALVSLGSDGSAPRVTLGPAAKPGTKRSGSIEVATQSDPRQGAVPIAIALTLEALKPKGDADPSATTVTQIVARVTGATINAPGVPGDVAAAAAKLKGSRVEYQVTPEGAGSNFHYEAAKGVDPAFRDAIHSLSDTLSVLALPFPSKPVGVGAYWMVTSRDLAMGLDVVTYRLVKLDKLEGAVATLTLSTKRYAASPAFDVEGLPPDAPHTMAEFHGTTEGTLTIAGGEAFPKAGQLDSMVAAALGAPDANTKQRAMVQLQTRAVIAF